MLDVEYILKVGELLDMPENNNDSASVQRMVATIPVDEKELAKLQRKAEKSAERLQQIKMLNQRIDELDRKVAKHDKYETSVEYCIETAKHLIGAAECLVKFREPTSAEKDFLASS